MVYQLQRPSIEMIIDYCRDLLADEKLEVYEFDRIVILSCISIRMGSILHPRTKIFLTWSGFTLPETESGWMTQTILI